MGVLVVTAKDNSTRYLCSKCQLELESPTDVCACSVETVNSFDEVTLSLVPLADDEFESADSESAAQPDYLSAHNHQATNNPTSTSSLPRTPRWKRAKVSRAKLWLMIGLAVLLPSSVFYQSIYQTFASWFVEQSVVESRVLQQALGRYFAKHSQWPTSVTQLQQDQYFLQKEDSYFVLASQGDYQQVLSSPFFLKGITISWYRHGQSWFCQSTDLAKREVPLSCIRR